MSQGGGNLMASLNDWNAKRAKLTTSLAEDMSKQAAKKAAKTTKAVRSRSASAGPGPSSSAAAAAAGAAATAAAGLGAKVPLAKQVKDVLDFLQAGEGYPRSLEEVKAHLPQYDFSANGELVANLLSNPRVEVSDAGFAYKSEHGIRSKDQLLRYLRAHPDGTKAHDIKDAYRAVLEDAEALKAEGLLYRLYNVEVQCDVYFPVDERFALRLDQAVVDLYHDVQVPAEPTELSASLSKLGIKSALASVNRKKIHIPLNEKQKRKRRQMQPRAVTNQHMMHLFQGDQPDSIDNV